MIMRSATLCNILQGLLRCCLADVIRFCCKLQRCMLLVACCIAVVIGVLDTIPQRDRQTDGQKFHISISLSSFRYYSVLYVFFLLMLGFRFYSVFMCVCFFQSVLCLFFSFLCVYMFL